MKLQNKNIILTGASRGFGKYLAGRLQEEGATLLLTARNMPFEVGGLCGDLRDAWTPWNIVETSADFMEGRIDGVINNAAIQGPIGKTWETNKREWDDTLTVNLIAPIEICRLVVPKMLKYSHGKIVNLSGGGAANARPNYSAYATAKAGLVRFSECLAEELRGTGIDVNCVAPGKMPTGMLPPGETAMEQTMSDAADLVIFLLSEESNGITGKLISAVWDNWWDLPNIKDDLTASELYTLRRVTEVKAKA